MKNTIIVAMLLAITLPFMGAGVVRAQTVSSFTPEQQTEIDNLKQEITALIYQLIAVLQAELTQMQNEQNANTQPTVNPQPTNSNTGGTPTTQTVVQAPAPIQPTATIGAQYCQSEQAIIPISITGMSPSDITFHASSTDGQHYSFGQGFQRQTNVKIDSLAQGTYDYYLKIWTGTKAPFVPEGSYEDTRTLVINTTGSVSVAPCQ